MRILPDIKTIAMSGDHTGERRPIARVTVQNMQIRLHPFNLRSAYRILSNNGIASSPLNPIYDTKTGTQVRQVYANALFDAPEDPKEIPNIKSVTWNRSRSSSIATGQITILNNENAGALPIAGTLGLPGYYTPLRGISPYSTAWGHIANEWVSALMPDNIIRTYEGYGCSPLLAPEKDTKLAITGTWLITDVELDANQDLVLKVSDLGELLATHHILQPIVPDDFYPLSFENWDGKVNVGNKQPARRKIRCRVNDTSNTPWIGSGSIAGHKPAHVLDGKPNTYWLSVGNDYPSRRFAYEWVELSFDAATISELKFRTVRKGYTAYVSVYANGSWQGAQSIDYFEDGIGQNGADIQYVKSKKVGSEQEQSISFTAIKNATKIRLTLGNLQYFNNGPFHYRGGIREMGVYGTQGSATPIYKELTPGPEGANPGRYIDFTNIVKLLLAWGGWFWPAGSEFRTSDGDTIPASFTHHDDAVLGHGVKGRVWGDFESSGSNGPTPFLADVWDKKTLLEAIEFVRDHLGYTFFIDETGAAQWRLSNVYTVGNWVTLSEDQNGRTSTLHRFDEKANLISYRPTLTSRSVREAIVVSDTIGSKDSTSVARGFNPNPTGQRRVSVVSYADFRSKEETQVYAELAAIRQMFEYRRGSAVVSGDPSIQLDDQVRIRERVTEEGYIHRINSINSTLDMVNGEYTMSCETHWLGVDPSTKWVVPPNLAGLSQVTREYIQSLTSGPGPIFRIN